MEMKSSSAGVLSHIISGIRNHEIKNIMVFTGAGISCNSGIPDFRSPGGLYATLDPSKLTATERQKEYMRYDPTLVVNYELFRINQFPYLEVRRPFILGTYLQQWKPTLAHYFIKLLNDKGILKRLYTQNIDGLDAQLHLKPSNKTVYVHGNLSEIACEFCQTPYNKDDFYHAVKTQIKDIYNNEHHHQSINSNKNTSTDIDNNIASASTPSPTTSTSSTHIICPHCHRPGIKPTTVLYGRNLPSQVFQALEGDFPPHVASSATATTCTASSNNNHDNSSQINNGNNNNNNSNNSQSGGSNKCNTSGTNSNMVTQSGHTGANSATTTTANTAVDLVIIIGSSLTVYPAASFIQKVSRSVPRLVINLERVGESLGLHFDSNDGDGGGIDKEETEGIGSNSNSTRSDDDDSTISNNNKIDLVGHKSKNNSSKKHKNDYWLQGDCDQGCLTLIKQLGWVEDVMKYKENMCTAGQQLLLTTHADVNNNNNNKSNNNDNVNNASNSSFASNNYDSSSS